MKFLDINHSGTTQNLRVTFSHGAEKDVQARIRYSIIDDIIRVSTFARDNKDEAYVFMRYGPVPDRVLLRGMEFFVAIYWMGLLKGVELELADMEAIMDALKDYAAKPGTASVGEIEQTMEVWL